MIKIAISGKANSGKNTLSKLLIKNIEKKYTEADFVIFQNAFATPIKNIVKAMFPSIPKKHLFGSSKFRNEIISNAFKNNLPLTIRQALLDIGTSAREYDPNVWINILNSELNKAQNLDIDESIFVVSDLRFRDEFNFLKENNFFFIRILRDLSPVINHVSETSQSDILDTEFNYIINNNGTLNDLKLEVSKIVDLLNINL